MDKVKAMPHFTLHVVHPDNVPLDNNNFIYRPYQSVFDGDEDITPSDLWELAEEALAELKRMASSSPFGFVFEDGSYDLFPSNECLGLINADKHICRVKPVAYFLGVTYGTSPHEGQLKGTDWLINRSPYAVVFETKDAKDALTKGVIMNTKHCVGLTVAALRSLYGMVGGMYSGWSQWAELVPEDMAWPFQHYLRFAGDGKTVTFSDGYSWSSTMGKNIGIDGIKRFVTHDYSLQDTVPMRDKPYRYSDFSHQWKTRDEKVHVPFKPATAKVESKKANPFGAGEVSISHGSALVGESYKQVAQQVMDYIGYPYA